jgi:hypothetical protein
VKRMRIKYDGCTPDAPALPVALDTQTAAPVVLRLSRAAAVAIVATVVVLLQTFTPCTGIDSDDSEDDSYKPASTARAGPRRVSQRGSERAAAAACLAQQRPVRSSAGKKRSWSDNESDADDAASTTAATVKQPAAKRNSSAGNSSSSGGSRYTSTAHPAVKTAHKSKAEETATRQAAAADLQARTAQSAAAAAAKKESASRAADAAAAAEQATAAAAAEAAAAKQCALKACPVCGKSLVCGSGTGKAALAHAAAYARQHLAGCQRQFEQKQRAALGMGEPIPQLTASAIFTGELSTVLRCVSSYIFPVRM